MSRAVAVVVGLCIAIALWSIIFHDTSGEWRTLQRLARSGVRVTGTVTAKEPMNHLSVRYDYFVDRVNHSGGPCQVHAQFDSIRVGDPITVTYLPESPTTSTCEDPQAGTATRAGILFVVVPSFAVLSGGLTSFWLYRRFGARPRSSSNQAMQLTAPRPGT